MRLYELQREKLKICERATNEKARENVWHGMNFTTAELRSLLGPVTKDGRDQDFGLRAAAAPAAAAAASDDDEDDDEEEDEENSVHKSEGTTRAGHAFIADDAEPDLDPPESSVGSGRHRAKRAAPKVEDEEEEEEDMDDVGEVNMDEGENDSEGGSEDEEDEEE